MDPNNHQNQKKLPSVPKRFLKEVGKTAGPHRRLNDGSMQSTFCYVFGVFDDNDNQVVHTKLDGTQAAIVFVSYPIDTDDPPIAIGPHIITPNMH